jgi:hypothetical protein
MRVPKIATSTTRIQIREMLRLVRRPKFDRRHRLSNVQRRNLRRVPHLNNTTTVDKDIMATPKITNTEA